MRAVSFPGTRLALAISVGALSAALPAHAESAFVLAWPPNLGRVPAVTYDERGTPLGNANLAVEQIDGGGIRIFSQSGEDRGAHNVSSAELMPVRAGQSL